MKKIIANKVSVLILILTSSVNAQETIFTAARSNNSKLLSELLLKKATIDSTDERGSTALIIACYNDIILKQQKYFWKKEQIQTFRIKWAILLSWEYALNDLIK